MENETRMQKPMKIKPNGQQMSRRRPASREEGERKKRRDSSHYFVTSLAVTPSKRAAMLKPPPMVRVRSASDLREAGKLQERCRSPSLQELSKPALARNRLISRGLDEIERRTMEGLETSGGSAEEMAEDKKVLAYKTYSKFLRKAWRGERRRGQEKEVQVKSVESEVSNLKLQVKSLKNLLKSDERTISGSFREISNLKGLLKALEKEYVSLKEEKTGLEKLTETLREEIDGLRTGSYNDKNSLLLAKSEASALETQLQREREKILKLKNENVDLLEKVEQLSFCLIQKTENMNQMVQHVEDIDKQMRANANFLKNSQIKIEEDKKALEEKRRELEEAKKELALSASREKRLSGLLDEARDKIKDQTQRYNKVIKEQVLKTVKLETELAMLEEPPVKDRLLRLASWALELPLAALTFGRLS